MARRRALIALAAIVLVAGAIAPATIDAAQRLCREPLDVSGTTEIPDFLSAIKERDEIAYPAHVAAASLLSQMACAPSAIALQWAKAASHARDDREVETTASGLAVVLENSGDPIELRKELCGRIREPVPPSLAASLARARLKCDNIQ